VIYIRANGSVDPADAPIQREGDIYTLTEDIYGSIVVERDDVVVDGTGYVLHGTGKETGVKLSGRNNVTIENMEIEAFHTGVIISDSSNNKLYENNITNNLYSIRLYQSSNNSMSGNNITASVFISIWLENSSDIVLCRNNVFANWFGLAVQGSSRNVVNENEIAENDQDGISLYSSSGNTISGNKIVKNNGYAVQIYSSSGNTISGNKIVKNNGYAVQIYSSSDNAISGNVVSENGGGIDLRSSSNNLFSRNNITVNKGYGIIVSGSSQVISGNIIDGNEYNLDISGDLPSHSIDISNLVDGKSVYYLVNKKNMVINPSTHPQVGYLALINCINITVQGLTLKDNGQGLLISNTNNSKIEGNNITNNWEGIRLDSSSNNSVSENNITNNYEAIVLMSSSNNSVSGNNITNNSFGVDLPDSSNNSVIGNNITANNYTAITLLESGNNAIFHNDFIDNTKQVFDYAWENPDILPSINVWDDGYPSGGNYWSDYAGVDSDPGGIGDTPYIIDANNTDRYPLMAPISLFDAGVWNGIAYNVDVVSNSTVSGFYFNPDEGSFLRFNVTGEDGRTGFCRVTIPKDLLWVDDGWTIFVGGEPITDYKTIPDENYTYLYFTYNHTTKTVEIQGTHVIPEFTSFAILPLLMIFTIFAVASVKKRLPRKPQT
jgi:parallel beta-helix repeat protein